MFESTNPTLNARTFSQAKGQGAGVMTVQGTVNKAFILLGLIVVSAWWAFNKILSSLVSTDAFGTQVVTPSNIIGPMMMVSVIGGFIACLVTIFKKEWSPVSAPIYALFEGVAMGAISAFFEMRYPGLVSQAVTLTFAVLFLMLSLYKSGIIKPTEKFKFGIVAATGAVAIVYLINMVMGFFGSGIPLITSSGPFGIGFSVIVVGIAALNLILDFEIIDQGAYYGAPKFMEWYSAFGLMVTLIWLYMEILRLLSKLRSRD